MPITKNTLPKSIPARVRKAMQVFTNEELNQIQAFVSQKTGRFWGLGFGVENGELVKPTDPKKLAALAVMETEYQKELNKMHTLWQEVGSRLEVILHEYDPPTP